jgi:2-C-methyl-D-erythritol 4-phosphate cytidylyltransferase
VWAIVVAAGSGARFGAPKQFEALGGRRVVDHAVAVAAASTDGVVLVAPESTEPGSAHVVVPGGATRSESVRRGLAAVPAEAEVIVVHDAARPLATAEMFRLAVDAVRAGADAAIPAVAVTDTLRTIDGGVVDRDRLVAVQTPQAFAADALRRAHSNSPEATDDAAVVEAAGGRVVLVAGDRWNLKITEPADLAVAEAMLAARA